VWSAAEAVNARHSFRVGAGCDDRVGPGVEVFEELVEVVTERVRSTSSGGAGHRPSHIQKRV